MYSVSVRDHFMVAHSFTGQVFGPAQRLHGATYVVDVEFRRPSLSEHGLVIDIGLAASALKDVLGEFNYQNLEFLKLDIVLEQTLYPAVVCLGGQLRLIYFFLKNSRVKSL